MEPFFVYFGVAYTLAAGFANVLLITFGRLTPKSARLLFFCGCFGCTVAVTGTALLFFQ
jgi:hypothetical protein